MYCVIHGSQGEDGQTRDYQFLAMREHVLGPILLCVVEEVHRLSRRRSSKGGKTGAKAFPGKLPASLCAGLVVRLLEPTSNSHFATSVLHKRLSLDAHGHAAGEPQVLWEIPKLDLKVKESSTLLRVLVSSTAVAAMKAIEGRDVAKLDSSPEPRPLFTAESFAPTAPGKKALKAYMVEMGSMYERVTAKNVVDIWQLLPSKTPWRELVELSSDYFDTMLLSKNMGGKKLAATHREYSLFCYEKLREAAPTAVRGEKPFVLFLRQVEKLAKPCLPTNQD